MSVTLKVELLTGATMGYENDQLSGSPERALSELDKGYEMIREWLISQLSPADQAKLRGTMPEPERRGQEIVRESIEDDLRTRRGWRL